MQKKTDTKKACATIRAHNETAPIKAAHDFSRLTIPFGDYPFALPDGKSVTQRFTPESARDICAELANSVSTGKSKGIPIYHGHPDVPDLAPKYPDKRAYGWIMRAEATGTGLDLFPEWNEEPKNHFSHISPFWMMRRSDYRVSTLISIALVNNPNIPELRLPNEEVEKTKNEENIMDMKRLALILGLAEDADEAAIEAEITRLRTAAADADTRAQAADAEAEAQKEAFANERTARIGATLDQALADGRITPAQRGAWEERLTRDFAAGSVALANEKPAVKTAELGKPPRVSDGGAQEASVAQQILALANEKMHKQSGLPFDRAYAQVKAERPDLFNKN
ncbi:MAG: phage protease [Kiritimatiellaeota bacterium]|nr:phage protease [Kiritimatiellota bacterium]